MKGPLSILTRGVRLVVNPGAHEGAIGGGYAGSPTPRGMARFYEFEARFIGRPDPSTGYLVDIKAVDAAMTRSVAPLVERACRDRPLAEPAELLPALVAALRDHLPALLALRWRVTPYYSVEMEPHHASTVLLRQKFDFAASHRLNVPALSEAENRALFGKCNNAAGHGHNYQVEPCIAIPVGAPPSDAFTLSDLVRLAEAAIIRPFDHKHLNTDTAEFSERDGVNPSVENIAAVFFRLLDRAIRAQPRMAELRSLTVWETDRTSATYPA